MIATKAMTVRVQVTEVWDTVALDVTPDMTAAQVKVAALASALGRPADPAGYVIKFRGAAVDESRTLAALGAPDQAPFIVLPARRQPVR